MQFNQRMAQAKQDADLAYFEEQQRYDPHNDTPGTFHDRVAARVKQIYDGVYSTVPEHLKPTALAHIATANNHYSDSAAKGESQTILSAAKDDLDKIVANYKTAAKGNPDSAKDGILAMRQAVSKMSGSFSDGQRKMLSRQYEDQIADEAVAGYTELKRFDDAKSFATDYAKQRDQTYGPGRIGAPGPQSDAGDKLDEGGAHGYSGRGSLAGVKTEPWLIDTVRQAAKTLPDGYTAKIISTVDARDTGTPWHPSGRAIDIQIYDDKGNKIPNEGSPRVPGWSVYENMAAAARAYAEDKYGKRMTWGGHFDSGTPYDRMHFQSGGRSNRDFAPGKVQEGRNAINDAIQNGGNKTVTDPASGKKTKSSELTPDTPIPEKITAGVVDEEGNKVVVDPKTGKMVRQADLEQPPVKVARSAAVGGITDAPPPEARAGAVDPSKYETKLSPAEEKQFQTWKAKNAPNDSGQDYDLRGAFKAGVTPDPDNGHMPGTPTRSQITRRSRTRASTQKTGPTLLAHGPARTTTFTFRPVERSRRRCRCRRLAHRSSHRPRRPRRAKAMRGLRQS